MNKKAVAAAGGAAALVLMSAGPASACTSNLNEKEIGPNSVLHFRVAGCGPKSYNEPSADAPFLHATGQKWTYNPATKIWTGVVHSQFWGILKDHPKTKTSILVGCAGGNGNSTNPVLWNPDYNGHGGPNPSESPSPTAKPTPSMPAKPKTIKVTVTPQYFHAGDTLHVAVYRCPAKPTVHSQILEGGAAWKHAKGVWKTPVHVAKGLREGYYNFTVTCKGFKPVVFKVKYGSPKDTSHHPAKHTPGHQTTDVPGGAPETGGGSTAEAFV